MSMPGKLANGKETVLVVVQLSGGNDFMNTVIPHADPLYYDFRKSVAVSEDDIIRFDDRYGFHPSMGPLKELWDQGKMAIVAGIGYPNPNRSHFRSMDIWHTCEPDKVATEGWLGLAIRDLDPKKENVVTGVNFGPGIPRALAVPGVPVACVANLANYGVLTGISVEEQRDTALDIFQKVYGSTLGTGSTMDYVKSVGMEALYGAELLQTAPSKYSSTVEYASNTLAQSLRSVAQVHLANLGTRIFYTQYSGFDVHANEVITQKKLWADVAQGIADLYADLQEHSASQEVIILVFSEFGRRVRDNGNGTDHGSGGGAFVIGDLVKGGIYGEYPSLAPEKQLDGDLHFNYDFRGLYATIAEQWLGIDPVPVVGGTYEQLPVFQPFR